MDELRDSFDVGEDTCGSVGVGDSDGLVGIFFQSRFNGGEGGARANRRFELRRKGAVGGEAGGEGVAEVTCDC